MNRDKAPTREQLYALVWALPVLRVAKDLGISDVALAKRCRREGVPLPPRGYWAKVAAGQTPAKPSLGPKPEETQSAPKASPQAAVAVERFTPAAKPARRKVSRSTSRLGRNDQLEKFRCKIDRYQRDYYFGVNWRIWGYNRESWTEYDCLKIFATIRSRTRHPYSKVELQVFPMHWPRDKINKELDSIGYVWTDRQKKGCLFCAAHVPTDAYYGVCDSVGRNEFVELVIEIRNLRYGRGSTSSVRFDAKPADLSEDEGL